MHLYRDQKKKKKIYIYIYIKNGPINGYFMGTLRTFVNKLFLENFDTTLIGNIKNYYQIKLLFLFPIKFF